MLKWHFARDKRRWRLTYLVCGVCASVMFSRSLKIKQKLKFLFIIIFSLTIVSSLFLRNYLSGKNDEEFYCNNLNNLGKRETNINKRILKFLYLDLEIFRFFFLFSFCACKLNYSLLLLLLLFDSIKFNF